MNVNDYVLTEKYVKQCVRECFVKPDIDLDSDHLILITSSYILITRKARRRSKGKVKVNLLNLDHYKIQKPRQLLWTRSKTIYKITTENLNHQQKHQWTSPKYPTLLPKTRYLHWPIKTVATKYGKDQELIRLLSQCRHFPRHDAEYKTITKVVKKWIKHLINEKCR